MVVQRRKNLKQRTTPPAAIQDNSAINNHAPALGPVVCLRGWLEWNGQSLLGRGRLALLENIEKHGSISAAARNIGISYRAAWNWISAMNAVAPTPLVETATGGAGGGGAKVTETGKKVLKAFRLLNKKLKLFNARMNVVLEQLFQPENNSSLRCEGEASHEIKRSRTADSRKTK